MTRLRLVPLALAVLLIPTPTPAQTLPEILARYLETRGGAGAFAALETARLRTTMTFPYGTFPVTFEFRRPNRFRVESVVQGLTSVTAYDGTIGWGLEGGWGQKQPEWIPEPVLRELRETVDFVVGPLVDVPHPTLLGRETIEGTAAFELELRKDDGTVLHSYLDPVCFLEFKRKVFLPGEEVPLEITLGNYKEVAGILVPHWIVVGQRTFTIDAVELNTGIDDDRFAPPGGVPPDLPPPTTRSAVPPPSPKTHAELPPLSPSTDGEVDSDLFGGLRARAIGPAVMSGRIAALDAVPGPPATIYVGAAGGGVWKSADGGITFRPVFDEHPQAVGALRVDPSNPEVVWVGTGESWVRNSVSVGRGVFKSADGGTTWQDMGLHDTERVSRIRVDPANGDVVWVCATGHLWDDHEARGVFRTRDGGASWEKVLYVDEKTGCADLELDPRDPRTLYATMWELRRWPYFFVSGGPGSGLYKSTDGGDTWRRLAGGLPEGELGRISVAVAPSQPDLVYATVEAEESALYRSENGGETWTRGGASFVVTERPFYCSDLVVDPTDPRRLYRAGVALGFSSDGGVTFRLPEAGLHSDHHALWVNPDNPYEVLTGTDGGLYVSHDRARHWRRVGNLPLSQFYHVSYDLEWPYNVYGGLQDNFSWKGPSRAQWGIRNRHWEQIGTGDGMYALPDRGDPRYVYTEYQGGEIFRLDQSIGELQSIQPMAEPGQAELRFNWNAPLQLSHHDPATLYAGSQFVHRSRDRGASWETISPDLTTDDPAKQRQQESGGLTTDNTTAENHCTLYALSESPRDAAVLWAGSDDGRLHVTRDSGASWTDVVGNVPGLPPGTWVSSIDASPHDAAAAFVTFDGHRTGDMAAYVYRADAYGASWTPLATPEIEGFARVIRQDPVNPDLIYLGTGFGLYLTLDGGRRWARFAANLPQVAVYDLAIHPTAHDLIVATHGRGLYILDDLTPLRALSGETLRQEAALLPSRPATRTTTSFLADFQSDEDFIGETVPEAVPIHYYLKTRHLLGDLAIEVLDARGERVAELPASPRRGINRVYWPMRYESPRMAAGTSLVAMYLVPGGSIPGPRVPEGTYTVRLKKGEEVLESAVSLVDDPRSTHSAEDRRQHQEVVLGLYHQIEGLADLTGMLAELRDQSGLRGRELAGDDARRLADFAARLEAQRAALVSTNPAGVWSGDDKLRERLGELYAEVVNYEGRPTETQRRQAERLAGELTAASEEAGRVIEEELPGINALLERSGLPPLERPQLRNSRVLG